jgi:4-hydroxythreonine-4-phosphate dehydrogenase
LTVRPEALLQGESSTDWRVASTKLDDALQQGVDVLLTIDSDDTAPFEEGRRLCVALGRLVAPLAPRLGGLLATGGDTARGILDALGTVGLRLTCEIEPGVTLSVTEGERPLPVVTKAGAFGSPASLVHCRAVLSGAATAKG